MPHHFGLIPITRILAVITGAGFIYLSIFTYEEELRRLQDGIETLWLRMDFFTPLPFITRLLSAASILTNRGYDRALGPKLLSRRAFYVSACYSIASASLFGIFAVKLSKTHALTDSFGVAKTFSLTPHNVVVLLCITFSVYLALGTWPAFNSEPSQIRDWLKRVDKLVFLPLLGVSFITPEVLRNPALALNVVQESWRYYLFGMLLASFACDLIFVMITRRILRWCTTSFSAIRIFGLASANLLLGILFYAIPFSLPIWQTRLLAAFNVVDILAAFMLILMALLIISFLAMRPILIRTVYLVARYRFFKNQRALLSVGAVLVMYGVAAQDVLRSVIDILK